MRVKDIRHLAEKKKGKTKTVFNPTTSNFAWKWNGKEYKIPKGDSITVDIFIAEHLAKHLIDQILTDKGIPTNAEEKRKEWTKKVLI